MKDYSDMSDFEINKAVAFKLGLDWSGVTEENRFFYQTADYCNNPADAWPIIYGNGISIGIYGYGQWGAGTVNHNHVDGVNPLRSAMIVYLQMMEQKP